MEPASIYLAAVCGAFGVWLAGERLWAAGTVVGAHWPEGGFRSRAVTSIVAVMLAFTLLRVGSVGAATLPMHERVVLESEAPSSPSPKPILNRFTSVPVPGAVVPTNPTTHTVERGECLWRIARSTLSASGVSPSGAEISDYWRSIYDLNRELIGDDPNLIHPGQVLQLPER